MVLTKAKVLKHDINTKKEEIVEENIDLPETTITLEPINLEDLKKLVTYAKKMGWI
jgi:hypothetical protein